MAPVITQEGPASCQALMGDEVALTAEAQVTDWGRLSYQWYRSATNSTQGGTPIKGAVESRYLPPTTQPGEAYYYAVVQNFNQYMMGNTIATTTGRVVKVEVNPRASAMEPVIAAQPQAAVVTQGEAAGLTVAAGVPDGGTLSYQWYRSATNSAGGGTPIEGAVESSYTPPTGEPGTAFYYVVVTNTQPHATQHKTATTTSAVAAVTVKGLLTVAGVAAPSRAYNGAAYAYAGQPVFTGTGGAARGISPVVEYSADGASYGAAAPTNAGSYWLRISAAHPEYTITPLVLAFRIAPAAFTAGSFGYSPPVELTQDGRPKAATVGFALPGHTGLGTLAVSYQGTDGTAYGPTTSPPSAAGSYRVLVSTSGATNYTDADGLELGRFTIVAGVVKVTGVKANMAAKQLRKGQSVRLRATVSPANATDKRVVWKSSNSRVAQVSASGVVKAVKDGKATITATAGGRQATVAIQVSSSRTAVGRVKLSSSRLRMNARGSHVLQATVSPAKASNKKLVWASSNTRVAAVNSRGKVTAKAAGTAVITATSQEGGKVARCTVTVKPAATRVKLNRTRQTLVVGRSVTLKATIAPAAARGGQIGWKSSNPKVATVTAKGRVRAVARGTATITATVGNRRVSCRITVR